MFKKIILSTAACLTLVQCNTLKSDCEALAEREDLKYVSDVAPDCCADLCGCVGKRYFATPKKMGAETAEANINAGLAAARQIVEFFATGCTKFQVNK